MDTSETFSERLQRRAGELGLDQAELARQLGAQLKRPFNRKAVNRWWLGECGAKGATLPALARVLQYEEGSAEERDLLALSTQARARYLAARRGPPRDEGAVHPP